PLNFKNEPQNRQPNIQGRLHMKTRLLSGVVLAAGLAFAGMASADDLKIGVAGPLTGPNAAFGAQLQKGGEQAAADINAAGGVLGNKIVMSDGDHGSHP